jgi:hypothetical protein
VKSDRCFETVVENVHFDKHGGRAEVTRVAAEDFARRMHPDRCDEFVRTNASAPYPVYLDFENVFTGIENSEAYRTLLSVIRRQEISLPNDKIFLACFVAIQQMRSHAIMNATLEWQEQLGRSRFEHLIMLHWFLSDPDTLLEMVRPILYSHWTLFVAPKPCLPLCDSPVLASPTSVMVALSPSLLLEILPQVAAGVHQCRLDDHISTAKLEDFRRRTIGNTFREIIFGDRPLLEEWQASAEFAARVKQLRGVTSYNRLVAQHSTSELWHLNAFGNQR